MKILFVCVHNKRRSVMAEAFGRKFGLDAYSAGVEKTENIDDMVFKVMSEKNLKIKKRPQTIDGVVKEVGNFDIVVTMGCLGACPLVPAKKHIAWNIEDPADKDIEFYRKVRDEIEDKVRELANSLK
ncbi:arsenate reductase/protein-tyrosine-phosphatase family protein [Methanothermococcus okinawensis]|uniref:Protein tyrosine phosphatase n=1 Tax=Methanothermococcus okinawensis (strain DSM 14208 / JCM 11175 / IH1) TaxID=647113 RepID=F8ALQ6_METOI|nr:low molecular weight phosphatase family protein [Methanothermococcus okinawensis]AEH06606.1 protein tyrosine phosphatase [Methanothermococcus okinawensis IH1]